MATKRTKRIRAATYAAELGDLALQGIRMGSERWAAHYAIWAWHYAQIAIDENNRILRF